MPAAESLRVGILVAPIRADLSVKGEGQADVCSNRSLMLRGIHRNRRVLWATTEIKYLYESGETGKSHGTHRTGQAALYLSVSELFRVIAPAVAVCFWWIVGKPNSKSEITRRIKQWLTLINKMSSLMLYTFTEKQSVIKLQDV